LTVVYDGRLPLPVNGTPISSPDLRGFDVDDEGLRIRRGGVVSRGVSDLSREEDLLPLCGLLPAQVVPAQVALALSALRHATLTKIEDGFADVEATIYDYHDGRRDGSSSIWPRRQPPWVSRGSSDWTSRDVRLLQSAPMRALHLTSRSRSPRSVYFSSLALRTFLNALDSFGSKSRRSQIRCRDE
jgi:hypothetical protein